MHHIAQEFLQVFYYRGNILPGLKLFNQNQHTNLFLIHD